MKIHEYQAKSILRKYGVNVPDGYAVRGTGEVGEIARKIGFPLAVKAQIHAGGRGKAGGVKLAKSLEESVSAAADLLGKRLYSPQTGPEGKQVNNVPLEEGINIASEFYLGILVDRQIGKVLIMASSEGGVEIEQVAGNTWTFPPASLHSSIAASPLPWISIPGRSENS